MKFVPAPLKGCYIIHLEPVEDHRGFFSRSFCQEEFRGQGLETNFVQCNLTWNREIGTLRGMHYQLPPHGEVKVIRCTRGSIYDVMVDLREDSSTYCGWFGVTLTASDTQLLYIPTGFAHGYQALEPDTEVFYMVSNSYSPDHERGVRWNDSAFNIAWPLTDPILSEKDKGHPDFIP